MRRAGQNREPRVRHTRAIPACIPIAAAEQFEKLDRVRGTNAIGVPNHDHRRRVQRRDLF